MATALYEHRAKGAYVRPVADARTPNGWWVGLSPNTTLSAGNTGNAGKALVAPAVQASAPLEIDALVDGQAEQVPAQAVQPHLDRTGADRKSVV